MRSKLHIEVTDHSFPGQTVQDAAQLVSKARSAVNIGFQGGVAQPDYLMVDRGKGFYNTATGKITKEFKREIVRAKCKIDWINVPLRSMKLVNSVRP